MKKISIAVLFFFLMGGLSFSADKGTSNEAQTMVKKAEVFLKKSGKDKAFPEFNDPKGKFVKKDLYIYVLNMDGVVISHGTNKALIGKKMIDIQDPDGKRFIKEIVDEAKTKEDGWIDYKYTNPVSKKIEQKTVYFKRVGPDIVACGAYK